MGMSEDVTNEVYATICDRKNLVVAFDFKLQSLPEIFPDIREKLVETFFVRCEEYQIIGISEIISYPLDLFEPVIETGQVEISQILAEIVPDRKAVRAFDDLIQ